MGTAPERFMNFTRRIGVYLVLFGVFGGGCGVERPSREQALSTLVSEFDGAGACVDGDTCIIAGQGNCSCGRPINSKSASTVAEAVLRLNSTCAAEDFLADCIAYVNPKCEANRCVAEPR